MTDKTVRFITAWGSQAASPATLNIRDMASRTRTPMR
jgi:hypothetical protein